jgi:hypothetical protein
MDAFATRLAKVMRVGDLTIADLHHWFNRPRYTVRMWVLLEREPRGPAGRLAHHALDRLEKEVMARRGFPVPANLSSLERPAYIRQVRDGLRTRVPARGSA